MEITELYTVAASMIVIIIMKTKVPTRSLPSVVWAGTHASQGFHSGRNRCVVPNSMVIIDSLQSYTAGPTSRYTLVLTALVLTDDEPFRHYNAKATIPTSHHRKRDIAISPQHVILALDEVSPKSGIACFSSLKISNRCCFRSLQPA
jgi:hypothetical protein